MPYDLNTLRALLVDRGSHSHTSNRFQEDVLSILDETLRSGEAVLELGCYRGGLSAIMANHITGKIAELWVVDFDPNMTSHASGLLKQFGLDMNVRFRACTLQQLVREGGYPENVSLAVIDADHRYQSVLEDIRTLKRLEHRPRRIIFHDYGLRYPEGSVFTDVNVQRAVQEEFNNSDIRLIGSAPGQGGLGTADNPGKSDGCFFVDREGAVVSLSE